LVRLAAHDVVDEALDDVHLDLAKRLLPWRRCGASADGVQDRVAGEAHVGDLDLGALVLAEDGRLGRSTFLAATVAVAVAMAAESACRCR